MADTEDEQTVDEDEELRQRREAIELAQDQLELEDRLRNRRDQQSATAETALAIHLAGVAETARDHRLSEADELQHRARLERARGNHDLDRTAVEPDAPGADETAARGRVHRRNAVAADDQARANDRVANRYDAEARALRSEVESAQQPGQPPASDAAYRPERAPEARVIRRRERKKRLEEEEDPNALRHKGLGL
ncbi:hypothetical protein EV646_107335 [Kribbella antiqua]|uniref:Uncharacterized protein n=1 Tax=Kribbella antiqua TaxID=2512217 RepID=A0A4R2IMA9_9ACTN|nr:hypothetical protein [Kribbella antiqua]TCO46311.1 hypothetical protein EV646_107335 [Kribbella antiqua]